MPSTESELPLLFTNDWEEFNPTEGLKDLKNPGKTQKSRVQIRLQYAHDWLACVKYLQDSFDAILPALGEAQIGSLRKFFISSIKKNSLTFIQRSDSTRASYGSGSIWLSQL